MEDLFTRIEKAIRKKIVHPGSRRGKYYINEKGEVVYGERKIGGSQHALFDESQEEKKPVETRKEKEQRLLAEVKKRSQQAKMFDEPEAKPTETKAEKEKRLLEEVKRRAAESKKEKPVETKEPEKPVEKKPEPKVETPEPEADQPKLVEKVPPVKEKQVESVMEDHGKFFNRFFETDVPADEYKAKFDFTVNNKQRFLNELTSKTKAELLSTMGSMSQARYKNEKKEVIVDALYHNILQRFHLEDTFSYSPFSETFEAALKRKVDKVTDQDIKNYKEKVKKEAAERKEKIQKLKLALENPTTLENLETIVSFYGRSKLTPEQLKKYLELKAGDAPKIEKQIEAKPAGPSPEKIETGVPMKMIAGKHTKHGYNIWTVQLTERVERDKYNEYNAKAKKLGGYYSSFKGNGAIPGFVFKDEDSANKFMGAPAAKPVKSAIPENSIKEQMQNAVPEVKERVYEPQIQEIKQDYLSNETTPSDKQMTKGQRKEFNDKAREIIQKDIKDITEEDLAILAKYTGRGGLADKGEGGAGLLNEYYTPKHVVNFMYNLAKSLGFEGGDVLEPSCGTGNFIQNAPKNCKVTGVELDQTSAKIAQILSPDHVINQMPFEAFQVTNDKKFDLVIGNVPFGTRISDGNNTQLDLPEEKNADRYFITRSVDNAKDGGLVMVIAAHSVLSNNSNAAFRKNIQKKAEFLGAVRLPSKTFSHTEVVSDVLIFRKRPEGVRNVLENISESDVFQKTESSTFTRGDYYNANPDHMIGEEQPKETASGNKSWFYKIKGEADPETLGRMISTFKPASTSISESELSNYGIDPADYAGGKQRETVSLSPDEASQMVQNKLFVGQTKVINGKVYILNANHRWELMKDQYQKDDIHEKLKAVNELSSNVVAIKEAMKTGEDVSELQDKTKKLYDEYEAKHGRPEDDSTLNSLIKNYRSIRGVTDIYNIKNESGAYSDLFEKKNIFHSGSEGTKLDQGDFVAVCNSLRENGAELNPDTVAAQFKITPDEARKAMIQNPNIFVEDGKFFTESEYMEGSAKEKIEHLGRMFNNTEDADLKKKYMQQIVAVRNAAGYKSLDDVQIFLGDKWIPEDILESYLHFKFVTENRWNDTGTHGLYRDEKGVWQLQGENWQEKQYLYYLRGQKQRSKNIDTEEYKKTVEKDFKLWLEDNPDKKERFETVYNDMFHDYIPGQKDSHSLQIAGMDPQWTLNRAQREDINFLFKQGKGISAMGVGFGKTFSMIALSQYRKQMGLEKKAFLQVPNNKVKDWEADVYKLFPNAKVLTIDSEVETTPDKLYKKLQLAAKNDYDFIICAESKAEEIGMSSDFEKQIEEDIYFQMNNNTMPSENSKDRDQVAQLQKFRQDFGYKESGIKMNFEDLGCDAMYVDEAHHLKNLWKPKVERNKSVLGLNLSKDSNRALAAWKKSEYIRRNNNDKGVFFATATPFTNTALEFYNMLSHIAPKELSDRGLRHIDDFISQFAISKEDWVSSWRSDQLVKKDIFVDYRNLDQLKSLLAQFVDFQNDPKKAELKKPKAEDKRHHIEPTDKQLKAIEQVRAEMDEWSKLPQEDKQSSGQNALTFWSQFRAITLDMELYDSKKYKNWENPKIKEMALTAKERFSKTKAGQVVFCDRVFGSDKSFNFHNKIKDYMVKHGGFKESEILVVNGFTKSGGAKGDASVEKEVSEAIRRFNAGEVKVLLGTTWTLGEGVNIQDNTSDLYHLDIPYRPSDYEQRNGRIDRQGNKQEDVKLHYIFGSGIDNAAFEMVSRKERMIAKLTENKNLRFQTDDGVEIDYMSPLGMKYMTSQDESEKTAIIAEFKEQKEQKVKEEKHKSAKQDFQRFIKESDKLRGLKKDTPEHYALNASVNSLKEKLRNNPEFSHSKKLDSNNRLFYNADKNTVLEVGQTVKDGTTLSKIVEIENNRITIEPINKSGWEGKTDLSLKDGYAKRRIDSLEPVEVADIEKEKFRSKLGSGIRRPSHLSHISDSEMKQYEPEIRKEVFHHSNDWLHLSPNGDVIPYKYGVTSDKTVMLPTAENKAKAEKIYSDLAYKRLTQNLNTEEADIYNAAKNYVDDTQKPRAAAEQKYKKEFGETAYVGKMAGEYTMHSYSRVFTPEEVDRHEEALKEVMYSDFKRYPYDERFFVYYKSSGKLKIEKKRLFSIDKGRLMLPGAKLRKLIKDGKLEETGENLMDATIRDYFGTTYKEFMSKSIKFTVFGRVFKLGVK